VHRHVERGNDDLGKALEIFYSVEAESDDAGDLGGACRVAVWRSGKGHDP